MVTDLYPPLTTNEVQRWAEFGLITPEQLAELKQHSISQNQAPMINQLRGGINLLLITYYVGVLIILLAYTMFMGFS